MHDSKRLAAALTIAISIFSSGFCQADQLLPQTFNNFRDGFSISFPASWAPMPTGKLESANKAAEAQHPDWKRPVLHYGYEMTNSLGLAFPPYMIMRVTETASAPDAKAVENDLEKGDELPQSIKRDKPIFDRELNAFLQKYSVNIAGAPPIEVSVAFFPTKRSIIKMFFYAPPAANGGAGVPIQQIIRSVQIEPEIRLPRPAPASRTGLIVALLAMAAIVLVLARAKPANRSQDCPTNGLSQ